MKKAKLIWMVLAICLTACGTRTNEPAGDWVSRNTVSGVVEQGISFPALTDPVAAESLKVAPGPRNLSALSEFQGLKSLSLSGVKTDRLDSIESLSKLEVLVLIGTEVSDWSSLKSPGGRNLVVIYDSRENDLAVHLDPQAFTLLDIRGTCEGMRQRAYDLGFLDSGKLNRYRRLNWVPILDSDLAPRRISAFAPCQAEASEGAPEGEKGDVQ